MTRYIVMLKGETWMQVSVQADSAEEAVAAIDSVYAPIEVNECDGDGIIVKRHKVVDECEDCGNVLLEHSHRVSITEGTFCGKCWVKRG
jgi:hypothetical protein